MTQDPTAFYRRGSAREDHTAPAYVPWRLGRVLASEAVTGAALEIGCGVGGNLGTLSGQGLATFGVDLSERALAEARGAVPGTHLAVANAARLPFSSSAFGLVVVTEVLEHVRRPEPVVAEAARVLRPGGTLFVTSPNYANGAGLRKRWRDWRSGRHDWNPWGAHVGGFEAFMTRRRLLALLAPWFDIRWEEGLDAGLGLSGGLPWVGRLASTGPGARLMLRLADGPLAPHRPMGRRLGMNTAILAIRRSPPSIGRYSM
jgi:SAM-dependent methyltransferase